MIVKEIVLMVRDGNKYKSVQILPVVCRNMRQLSKTAN